MKVAYVAGPYRGPNAWAIEQNIRAAESVALECWRMGLATICPHANTRFFQDAAPDRLWLDGDLEFVRRSDVVVLVPGWEESAGARSEVHEASRLGIPVVQGIEALARWQQELDESEQGADDGEGDDESELLTASLYHEIDMLCERLATCSHDPDLLTAANRLAGRLAGCLGKTGEASPRHGPRPARLTAARVRHFDVTEALLDAFDQTYPDGLSFPDDWTREEQVRVLCETPLRQHLSRLWGERVLPMWAMGREDLSLRDLRTASLHGACLDGANMRHCNLEKARLRRAALDYADLAHAKVCYADLASASMTLATLCGCDLSQACLLQADLRDVWAMGACLRGALMRLANIGGANFTGADLSLADLSRSSMDGATLREANLRGATLDGAKIEFADLTCAVYDRETVWPHGFDPVKAGATPAPP